MLFFRLQLKHPLESTGFDLSFVSGWSMGVKCSARVLGPGLPLPLSNDNVDAAGWEPEPEVEVEGVGSVTLGKEAGSSTP